MPKKPSKPSRSISKTPSNDAAEPTNAEVVEGQESGPADLPEVSKTKAPEGIVVFDDTAAVDNEPDEFTKKFKNLKNTDYEQNITLRKHFSWATFGLVAAWLFFVAIYISVSSRNETFLISLTATTTIKVLGLYYIVLRYIFPMNGPVDDEDD